MKKDLKKIPRLRNRDEEFKFWSTQDLTDYVDLSKGKRVVFPNLKPTPKAICIKVPLYLLNELKNLANRKGVPYQSLMKVYLEEKVRGELR